MTAIHTTDTAEGTRVRKASEKWSLARRKPNALDFIDVWGWWGGGVVGWWVGGLVGWWGIGTFL